MLQSFKSNNVRTNLKGDNANTLIQGLDLTKQATDKVERNEDLKATRKVLNLANERKNARSPSDFLTNTQGDLTGLDS